MIINVTVHHSRRRNLIQWKIQLFYCNLKQRAAQIFSLCNHTLFFVTFNLCDFIWPFYKNAHQSSCSFHPRLSRFIIYAVTDTELGHLKLRINKADELVVDDSTHNELKTWRLQLSPACRQTHRKDCCVWTFHFDCTLAEAAVKTLQSQRWCVWSQHVEYEALDESWELQELQELRVCVCAVALTDRQTHSSYLKNMCACVASAPRLLWPV